MKHPLLVLVFYNPFHDLSIPRRVLGCHQNGCLPLKDLDICLLIRRILLTFVGTSTIGPSGILAVEAPLYVAVPFSLDGTFASLKLVITCTWCRSIKRNHYEVRTKDSYSFT